MRPIYSPKLPYIHETHPLAENCDVNEVWKTMNEWLPVFSETDADKRPDRPEWNNYFPPEKSFEEYAEYLAPVFHMKKERGIVEAMAYTPGEPGWVWSSTCHAYVHKLFELVGADRDSEILIFGSEGDNFFYSVGNRDCYRDTSKAPEAISEFTKGQEWDAFEHQYCDGTHDIEYEVNIEIPTIGIWQGGAFHSDIFLLGDITIATKDAWMVENHFRINMYPGDGVGIPWRMFMGQKRFAYAELTGQVVTARKALEYGMINEIVEDQPAAVKRAWEIADLIMHTGTRQTRRLTTQYIRRPLKQAVADELKFSFGIEMWNTITEQSPHHPIYWQTAQAQARAVKAAEKKGKVVKPRLGAFIEEDEIPE